MSCGSWVSRCGKDRTRNDSPLAALYILYSLDAESQIQARPRALDKVHRISVDATSSSSESREALR